MWNKTVLAAVLGMTFGVMVWAQEERFQSGLQPAGPNRPPTKMPHSFDVHTFNGKNADRFHCLVCENDIHPTVILFLKEPAEGKSAPIESLLGKLDKLIEKYRVMDQYPEVTTFAAYAVFLSPAAQTSLTKANEADPAKLVKEATDRRALYKRMKDWTGKTEHVIVGTAIPEAAKGYKIHPDAGLTGLFYDSLNVIENYAHQELEEGHVDTMIGRIDALLQAKIAVLNAGKKKATPMKKPAS